MRVTFSPNEHLQNLIAELRRVANKEKVMIWKRIAADLSKPSRQRREINLTRINANTKDNDTIVVPSKVLSSGEIDHKVQVAPFSFSKNAKDKITRSKGAAISINELLKSNPKGNKIRIIG